MKKSPNWPAYVEESNGRVVYRPRIKGAPPVGYRVDTRGKLSPAIKLGKVGDDDLTILRNYLQVRDTIFEGVAPKST